MACVSINNLQQEWRAFLRVNPDARVVINGLMERTGLGEDEVLFFLLEAWLASGQK
jgi:hypothetical protein